MQRAGLFFGVAAVLGIGIAVVAALRGEYLLAGVAVVGALLGAHLAYKAIRLARSGVAIDPAAVPMSPTVRLRLAVVTAALSAIAVIWHALQGRWAVSGLFALFLIYALSGIARAIRTAHQD